MGLVFRPRRPVMRLPVGAATAAAGSDARVEPRAPAKQSDERVATLRRALEAGAAGETTSLSELYTADVSGSSPATSVGSIAELARELTGRADAFSDVELAANAAVVDDTGYAEWVVTARHTGALVVGADTVIEPTGGRVTFRGVTVAEFSGSRICSFRQYWDELAMLENLGVLPQVRTSIS
jgi:ketosteroid isomerase-like protein